MCHYDTTRSLLLPYWTLAGQMCQMLVGEYERQKGLELLKLHLGFVYMAFADLLQAGSLHNTARLAEILQWPSIREQDYRGGG